MTFNVIQPIKDRRGRIETRKRIVDGHCYPQPYFPDWWEQTFSYTGDSPLPEIYKQIKRIEKEGTGEVIIAEAITRKEENGWFRARTTKDGHKDAYLEKDTLRNWIQLDLDNGEVGSRCNFLPVSQRLTSALAGLPSAISSCGMVVQLSNKAGLTDVYPDYMALRIYLELDTPMTNEELRKLFKHATHVDKAVFSNARLHYVGRPVIESGNIYPQIEGETVLYIQGKKLNTEEVRQQLSTTEAAEQARDYNISLKNLGNYSPDGEHLKMWKELARKGAFDKTDNEWTEINRQNFHLRVLSQMEWSGQNGMAGIDAICENGNGKGTLLGNRASRRSLEKMLKTIKKQHHDYFLSPQFSRPEIKTILDDPATADVSDLEFEDLEALIRRELGAGKSLGGVIHMAHGSGKTTAIVPLVQRIMKDVLGKAPTVLYICTLRSIIRSQTAKLAFAVYIMRDGQIDHFTISEADKLGICIRSIRHTHGIHYECVIVDESEEVGMWAGWDDGHSDVSRDYGQYLNLLADSKLFLLMDADASDMTYSTLARALERKSDIHTFLLKNSATWIRQQSQMLYLCNSEMYVWDKIAQKAFWDDEYCYVHVDFKDRKDGFDPKLSATCDAFNKMAKNMGKPPIAEYFDSTTEGTEKHNQLLENADEYLSSLYDKGIRIVIISPIIVSGWRYNGDKHFDASFGIYRNNFMTANKIIQKIERVTFCKEHYCYINPASTWTPLDTLEKQLQQVVVETKVPHSEYTLDAGKRMLVESSLLTRRNRDNIKLHTALLWTEEFGGELQYIRITGEEKKEELSVLYKTLNLEIKEQRLNQALELLHDEERLREALLSFKKSVDADTEVNIEPPQTPEELLGLLDMDNSYNFKDEDAEIICSLLSSDEEDWEHWGINGAPWEKPASILAPKRPAPKRTWKILGKLLKEMMEQLPFDEAAHLFEWLLCEDTRPTVIDLRNLDKQGFQKIAEGWHVALKEKGYTFYKGTSLETFIYRLFKEIFQCKVRKEEVKSGEVVKVKGRLVDYYTEENVYSVKTAKNKTAKYKAAHDYLKLRMTEEMPLHAIEDEYLSVTGSMMIIERPPILPARLSRHLRLYKIFKRKAERTESA